MSESAASHSHRWIIAPSILVPVVVAILFGVKIPDVGPFHWLPPIYAGVNATTACTLVAAVAAIKAGRRRLHERLILVSMTLSASFLVMYIIYHMTSDPTPYGGSGVLRYVYYAVLISHILLSIAVIPVVLFTFSLGRGGDWARHRRLAKTAFPLWLYVTVSGVVVYWMISPYYA